MQTKERIKDKLKELKKKHKEALTNNLENLALQYAMALIYLE